MLIPGEALHLHLGRARQLKRIKALTCDPVPRKARVCTSSFSRARHTGMYVYERLLYPAPSALWQVNRQHRDRHRISKLGPNWFAGGRELDYTLHFQKTMLCLLLPATGGTALLRISWQGLVSRVYNSNFPPTCRSAAEGGIRYIYITGAAQRHGCYPKDKTLRLHNKSTYILFKGWDMYVFLSRAKMGPAPCPMHPQMSSNCNT